MGYHIHHTIIVTCWQAKMMEKSHAKAKEIFGELCSEMVFSGSNGYMSFFIAPDGSKEGWQTSIEFDDKRDEYKKWLRAENSYVNWVEVSFGGDEPENNTEILDFDQYEEPTE